MKVFYVCIVLDRLSEISQNLPVIKQYLKPDEMVVVDGGSTDGTLEFLQQIDATVIRNPFADFVSQRNLYLDAIEEKANPGDLLIVSDSDEYLQPATLGVLRDTATQAYEEDKNLIRIRCRSEWTNRDSKVIKATLDDYSKPLVALWEAGGRYYGAGGRSIHEELHFPSGRRFYNLADENGTYVYVHRKQLGIQYLRAFRNFFLADLDPSGAIVPADEWHGFRQMFFDRGMKTWPEVEQYLTKGNIDREIKEWLIANRKHPVGEVRNSCKGYFVFCHPEEAPAELVEEYAEEIRDIHGTIFQ